MFDANDVGETEKTDAMRPFPKDKVYDIIGLAETEFRNRYFGSDAPAHLSSVEIGGFKREIIKYRNASGNEGISLSITDADEDFRAIFSVVVEDLNAFLNDVDIDNTWSATIFYAVLPQRAHEDADIVEKRITGEPSLRAFHVELALQLEAFQPFNRPHAIIIDVGQDGTTIGAQKVSKAVASDHDAWPPCTMAMTMADTPANALLTFAGTRKPSPAINEAIIKAVAKLEPTDTPRMGR